MFITNNLHVALKTDSKIDTRAMSMYVDKPDKIAKLFDDIAYEKCKARVPSDKIHPSQKILPNHFSCFCYPDVPECLH